MVRFCCQRCQRLEANQAHNQQNVRNIAQSIKYAVHPAAQPMVYMSPVWLIVLPIFLIFVSEILVMTVINFLPPFSSKLFETLFDSTSLIFLLSPVLYYFLFRPLLLQIKERNQTEEALLGLKNELEDRVIERTTKFRQAHEQLAAWATELEKYNHESRLLHQMVDFLQISQTAEESYLIIAQFASKLFPSDSGAMYLFSASRNFIEAATVWGKSPSEKQGFQPEECWALRRGQQHSVTDVSGEVRCSHVKDTTGQYTCMPMTAHGEILGVLHLLLNTDDAVKGTGLTDAKNRLLSSMAEHTGIAVANLKLREALRSLSICDPLTGLFNRRYMEESLEREQHRSERNKIALGIMMIDIDHFKLFNDTFGHDAGDTVLREVSVSLKNNVRGFDIVCRYGGEEFCIIMSGALLEVMIKRAVGLREAVKHLHVQHDSRPLGTITLSLGIAVFPQHGSTAQDVLQAADTSLYMAKETGRDRVCVAGNIV